jgi:hypothetical protein
MGGFALYALCLFSDPWRYHSSDYFLTVSKSLGIRVDFITYSELTMPFVLFLLWRLGWHLATWFSRYARSIDPE